MVSPTQLVLAPGDTATVNIVLHLSEEEVHLETLSDKFAIFYLDFSEYKDKEESIDEFIKRNKEK